MFAYPLDSGVASFYQVCLYSYRESTIYIIINGPKLKRIRWEFLKFYERRIYGREGSGMVYIRVEERGGR